MRYLNRKEVHLTNGTAFMGTDRVGRYLANHRVCRSPTPVVVGALPDLRCRVLRLKEELCRFMR